MAHVDTAPDVSGRDVRPQVHAGYQGDRIDIGEGLTLDPDEFPELLRHGEDTIITADGRTLLGADDKAGVAEVMCAVEHILDDAEFPHGEVVVVFTCDEETGKGMQYLPVSRLGVHCCYTVDGSEEGTIEAECFNAYKAAVIFSGVSMHTGTARGKLVNAVTMAGVFIGMLPRNESPEATDGRYGFYAPLECSGTAESATVTVFLRDFEDAGMSRRLSAIEAYARAVEAAFPGGSVSVDAQKQYANMHRFLGKDPRIVGLLQAAVRAAGMEPGMRIVRGGTDGARLSEAGIPTPNIFTGGHNYHSRLEWASLTTMTRSVSTILHLLALWADE
jgi:tripeptide aminopeptidase